MWNRCTERILIEILQELRKQTELLESLVPGRPTSLRVDFGKPVKKET